MFNEQKYINQYNKDTYKSIKFRVRKDEKYIIDKLSEVPNVNSYITSLIWKDIFENHEYHFIDNEVKIDFPVSKVMEKLMFRAEKADLMDNYGLYMNLAYAIDSQAKKETTHHQLRESQWNKLIRRYCL